MPAGGTSDYGPEMLHAAAQAKPYACFVAEDARLPFMAMPDAITALVKLAAAPAKALTQLNYNVTAFSLSAEQIRDHVRRAFPQAEVTFEPDPPRAAIVDTWPADVNDDPARRDWGWQPAYQADRAFDEYLVPTISRYYQSGRGQ